MLVGRGLWIVHKPFILVDLKRSELAYPVSRLRISTQASTAIHEHGLGRSEVFEPVRLVERDAGQGGLDLEARRAVIAGMFLGESE